MTLIHTQHNAKKNMKVYSALVRSHMGYHMDWLFLLYSYFSIYTSFTPGRLRQNLLEENNFLLVVLRLGNFQSAWVRLRLFLFSQASSTKSVYACTLAGPNSNKLFLMSFLPKDVGSSVRSLINTFAMDSLFSFYCSLL